MRSFGKNLTRNKTAGRLRHACRRYYGGQFLTGASFAIIFLYFRTAELKCMKHWALQANNESGNSTSKTNGVLYGDSQWEEIKYNENTKK